MIQNATHDIPSSTTPDVHGRCYAAQRTKGPVIAMEMSHLGYIAYLAMVISLFGSPAIVYALYRGWKGGFLRRAAALMAGGIPLAATVLYVIMRYGPGVP